MVHVASHLLNSELFVVSTKIVLFLCYLIDSVHMIYMCVVHTCICAHCERGERERERGPPASTDKVNSLAHQTTHLQFWVDLDV